MRRMMSEARDRARRIVRDRRDDEVLCIVGVGGCETLEVGVLRLTLSRWPNMRVFLSNRWWDA